LHKWQVIIKKSKRLHIIEFSWQLQHVLFFANGETENTWDLSKFGEYGMSWTMKREDEKLCSEIRVFQMKCN